MLEQVPPPAVPKSWLTQAVYWVFARKMFFGTLIAGGVLGWGVFATWITAVEYTSRTEFCLSCHVMADTVGAEYKESKHFKNQFGAHAGCPDCHVPQYDWIAEAQAKLATTGELYAYFFGGMSKAENFEKIRPQLAKDVWAKFEKTNARECRHCHDYGSMDYGEQKPSARAMHQEAVKTDRNCVACHKGITHKNYEEKKTEAAPTSFDVD
jgi:nitrate/TMAO reductase-like tetraheme cytochrome c subunit